VEDYLYLTTCMVIPRGDYQRERQVFFRQCDEKNQREKNDFGHGCFCLLFVCLLVFLFNFDLFAH